MIGFKVLRAVIAELHGVGTTPTALLGRFKYFQRMSFPGGSNVGRGARAEYSLSDVLALALAFEIQETAASPVRVVRLIRHQWPEIERAIILSWARLEGLGGQASVLAHSPGALAEMGLPDDEMRAPVDALQVIPTERVVEWLEHPRPTGAPSIYVIDVGRFTRQLSTALLSSGGMSGEALRERFLELGALAFGSANAASWSCAVDGDVARIEHGREGINR